MAVEIRRGTARFVSRSDGMVTRHSFSFGAHYDPANTAFGPLVCHDDHLLGAGRGFDAHVHRDLEIVTWVVSGVLRHTDSEGHEHEVRPGQVQVLSAGSGVTHAEVAGPAGPTRFVQAWLTPSETGTPPAYSLTDVALAPGTLVDGARVGDATFGVARLAAGDTLTLPDAPRVHVFVAGGALQRSSLAEPLADGDAFRITDERDVSVTAAVPTDLLVWTFE